MKTTIKAAILLLSGTIFFSQASLADNPNKPPKPAPSDCMDFPVELGSLCAEALYDAHDTLGTYATSFKSDKDFFGLRCKVVEAEVKMDQDKALDALKKLEKSHDKVYLLASQRKLDKTISGIIAKDIATARDCADPELPTP